MNISNSLAALIGEEHVLLDPESLDFFAQDIWGTGALPSAVVRPADSNELSTVVSQVAAAGRTIVGRGGGMSYTSGYVQDKAGAVVIDTSRMNKVIDINRTDMMVTVQAGCTWSDLYEALKKEGLRTPYWGPLSGKFATVGGSVSQNSIFWGGSRYGSAVESVISMELVLANGDILNTGSAAQEKAGPFFRHFGPDLTGLFCADCGALGIKSTITLKLMHDDFSREFLSFDFADYEGLLATMAEISRQDLASECFGFDPMLTEMRARRESLLSDAKSLGKVLKDANNLKSAAKTAANIIRSGRRFMKDLSWPLHVIVEERNASAALEVRQRILDIARDNDGTEVANTIPNILRSNPFGPLNNMMGAGGERWAPVHGLVPLSAGADMTAAILKLFEANAEDMEAQGIEFGFLYNSVAGACIAVEPLFYWPDAQQALHVNSVEADYYKRLPKQEDNPQGRELVAKLRRELVDLFRDQGATHLQIGRSYHYLPALQGSARELLIQLKRDLDPDNIINPGVLGFDL